MRASGRQRRLRAWWITPPAPAAAERASQQQQPPQKLARLFSEQVQLRKKARAAPLFCDREKRGSSPCARSDQQREAFGTGLTQLS